MSWETQGQQRRMIHTWIDAVTETMRSSDESDVEQGQKERWMPCVGELL